MLIYLQMIETDEDRYTFEEIYTSYRSLMYNIAMQILHNEHDAEDAVHQAFLSAVINIKKLSKMKRMERRAYLVVVAENKAIDIIRSNSHIIYTDVDETLYGIEIPAPGDDDLADAMARLPARYREILLLRYYSGFKTRELAQILEMSQSSVQKLIWRARQTLRCILEGDDDVR